MRFILLLANLAASPTALAVEQTVVQVRGSSAAVTVLVDDQENAVDLLVKEAEARGGYFRERSSTGVIARIPADRLDGYLEVVQGLGKVAERKVQNTDLATTRTRLASEVATREDMLKRYLANMGEAKDRDDLQAIQAATGELIAQIEQAKGSLRVVDHDARFAEVDVSFKLRERRMIRLPYETRFAWLSTVDLNQLLGDFAAPGENR